MSMSMLLTTNPPHKKLKVAVVAPDPSPVKMMKSYRISMLLVLLTVRSKLFPDPTTPESNPLTSHVYEAVWLFLPVITSKSPVKMKIPPSSSMSCNWQWSSKFTSTTLGP
jgi:hypothetical protein